ncbi:MAG: diacylglycerol kinase [Deltaproteobacteria bacterium]|nr:diacylglycerol kinase [Deltaproteobacteria bacterium]
MSVAIVLNLHARRGSERVAAMIRALLPRARLAVTRSLDEARAFFRDLAADPPTLLLSGGGDGTAVAMINELRGLDVALPPIGVLPLGTGNGWANVTHAPKTARALRRIAQLGDAPPPVRSFALVEVEGRVAPFAGTGWDAELVTDFHAYLESHPAPLRAANAGVGGYLAALFSRTIPRHVFGDGPAQVRLINTGEHALGVDEHGRVVRLEGGRAGAVLYEGPASVAAAATTEEWGFGFRSFPFAHAAEGRMSVRMYGAKVLEATRNMFKLWRGEYPLKHMHDFLLTRCRMELDRPVPFQIGGDVFGERLVLDFALSQERVDLVDWARLDG